MLSIVVPTYNEASNIEKLAERIFSALSASKIKGEVVIVDDASPDGTGKTAEKLSGRFPIKVVHREGRRGLSSAVLDGFSRASGDILCVIDADLSHPPEVIPKMHERVAGGIDFVIGSRLVGGGGSTGWSFFRKFVSASARLLARPITSVKDSTSGFFMIRRSVIDGAKLNPIGFKICLEIIAKGNYNRVEEIPIVFAGRTGERSKMGVRQIIEYLVQLAMLYFNRRK